MATLTTDVLLSFYPTPGPRGPIARPPGGAPIASPFNLPTDIPPTTAMAPQTVPDLAPEVPVKPEPEPSLESRSTSRRDIETQAPANPQKQTKATATGKQKRPDFEYGRRNPSAKDVIEGPASLSEDVEELADVPTAKEKVTTRRKQGKPLTDKTITAMAGTEMEAPAIEWLKGELDGPDVKVVANKDFPPDIRGLYEHCFGSLEALFEEY